MSWHGGSRVFSSVSDAIQAREDGEASERDVYVALIKALEDEGWDVGEAEVGAFDEDSPAREALREFGVVETCGAEHETEVWQCEQERGHHPATPHDDTLGHTWTDRKAE